MSGPRPADGAEPGSLHWLHRATGEPHWMVATWTGDAWNVLDGKLRHPQDLVWWSYAGPAVTPDVAHDLLAAARKAENYIANTEGELGFTLDSGTALRAAIARAEGRS
jgi:hypothetical protein